MNGLWHVFVVEDDDAMRRRLVRAVESSSRFHLAGQARGLSEAHHCMAELKQLDVLLVDLGLPDGHGVQLIRHARQYWPETKVLVISVFGDERSVARCIQAGASGYVLKDGSPLEVQQAMLDLTVGGSPLSPRVARYVLELARNPGLDVGPSPTPADAPRLSPRELEVLELLAKGFAPREIANLLDISVHTVVTHSRTIHRKLEVSSRAAAVFEALSLGLIKL